MTSAASTKRGDDLAETIEGIDEKDFEFLKKYEENHTPGELIKKSENLDRDRWYFIRFPARLSKMETKLVFLGINGQPWQFQRNQIVCVPWEVLAQLDNTNCREWELGENEHGQPQMQYEPKFRYNYELLGDVSEEQAEIWYDKHCDGRALPIITKKERPSRKKK